MQITDFRLQIDALVVVCSNETMNARGRILAIDYGEKNIGLACSDELSLTVQPLPSIRNCGTKNLIKKLRAAVRTLNVHEVVLGIPLNMDGTRGDAFLRMEQVMAALREGLKLPLHGVDERLSTVEALEFWQGMNQKSQRRYRTVDSLAAALILERYLREM